MFMAKFNQNVLISLVHVGVWLSAACVEPVSAAPCFGQLCAIQASQSSLNNSPTLSHRSKRSPVLSPKNVISVRKDHRVHGSMAAFPADDSNAPPPEAHALSQVPSTEILTTESMNTIDKDASAKSLYQVEIQAILDSDSARFPDGVSAQDILEIEASDKWLIPFEKEEIQRYPIVYFLGTDIQRKVAVRPPRTFNNNFGFDDKNHDYIVIPNDHIAYRYELIGPLGAGSFGQVMKAIDHATGKTVAIKINKNSVSFNEQALVEQKILEHIREADPSETSHLVIVREAFQFRHHVCLVFDLLDQTLLHRLKDTKKQGFALDNIHSYASQLVGALALLRRLNVIHSDVKPENILTLPGNDSKEIKLIDFGSSCYVGECAHQYIQSRFYRSPEVILGHAITPAIDMWSLGCVLAELYLGFPLFPGHIEQEMLERFVEVLGKPPALMVYVASRNKHLIDRTTLLPHKSQHRARIPGSKPLALILRNQKDFDEVQHEHFVDFVSRCLRWDPADRMMPDQARGHPWITGESVRPAAFAVKPVPSFDYSARRRPLPANPPQQPTPPRPSASPFVSLLKQLLGGLTDESE